MLAGGILGICALAVGTAAIQRGGQTATDPSTPEGVVSTFIRAVQNRDPDAAWDLLAAPEAARASHPGPRTETPTREAWRQQVINASRPPNRRIRMIGIERAGETARVNLEITYSSSGPFGLGGGFSQTRTFELTMVSGAWRITIAPSIYDLA